MADVLRWEAGTVEEVGEVRVGITSPRSAPYATPQGEQVGPSVLLSPFGGDKLRVGAGSEVQIAGRSFLVLGVSLDPPGEVQLREIP